MSKCLSFEYERDPQTNRLIERIHDCVESVSLAFDGYGTPDVKGPGLYLAIITGRSADAFADPMGSNRWPIETCRHVMDDEDSFYEGLSTVSRSCDGGVLVGVNGTILEQMVRFRHVESDDLESGKSLSTLEYADWMGARHMSAYELSLRPESVVTITLSEETGRVSVFDDGEYDAVTRDRLGEPWRASE